MISVINPSTEEICGAIDEYSKEEIDMAVSLARKGRAWAEKKIDERVEIIRRFAAGLIEREEEIAKTMAEEIGKPLKAGKHEVEIAAKRASDFCEFVPECISDEIIFSDTNEKNILRYEPKGVVAVISPWNAPVFVSLASIIPALLCGNNVVWKPSEYASLSGQKINSIFDKLKKEGLPEEAFQCIIGGKETGKYIVESDINMVSLTGSIRAGKEVVKGSADKLHSFVLELGGKDAAIILDDANLEDSARQIVKAATMYSGQVCFGVERAYCMQGVYDEFIFLCVKEMKKLKVGNPFDENTDLGPISVKFQFDKVLLHIKDALEKGARILCGAERIGSKGFFISPGVISEVNHNMLIMREETFGPILPVMKVNSVDEAVKLANDSNYGLSASVWTSDLQKGEEITRRIQAGTVEINRHGMSKLRCPWGGCKSSGIGRIYSKEGIRTFTEQKHVWIVNE